MSINAKVKALFELLIFQVVMQIFHKQPPKSLKYLFCCKTRGTTGNDLELLQKSNFMNGNAATKFLCHTIN